MFCVEIFKCNFIGYANSTCDVSLHTCDVTRCVICISKNIQYLDKEQNYKNSTKEVKLCECRCSLQRNQENTGQNLSSNFFLSKLKKLKRFLDVLKMIVMVVFL